MNPMEFVHTMSALAAIGLILIGSLHLKAFLKGMLP